MSSSAKKTDPKLWEEVKKEVTESDKGGKPGQWSARKAQMAVQEYKHEGGGYEGEKTEDNHLVQWEREEWGTKSGKPSGETGERYLPKEARESLTPAEYKRTTEKKRRDSRKGVQHSAQPKDVAAKTAAARHHEADHETKADLYRRAQERQIPGRSTMSKDQLKAALAA
jgi:hypothetical protein